MLLCAGLELVRSSVAQSTEETYLGHFGAWVNFRADVVQLPVFLVDNSDPLVNVWHLLEYIAYAYSVLGIRQRTIDGHLSAIMFSTVCRARLS